jgi:hypothetical protein
MLLCKVHYYVHGLDCLHSWPIALPSIHWHLSVEDNDSADWGPTFRLTLIA